jgi:hypothetical protein
LLLLLLRLIRDDFVTTTIVIDGASASAGSNVCGSCRNDSSIVDSDYFDAPKTLGVEAFRTLGAERVLAAQIAWHEHDAEEFHLLAL